MKWISIKERLPGFAGRVLVCRAYQDGPIIIDIDYHHYEIEKGCFGANSSCVTHWMPLPPPPGESINEQSAKMNRDGGNI